MAKHDQVASPPSADTPLAPSYYDVVLGTNIPQGSGILNQPCTVVFTYPGGSRSETYPGTVFAWFTQNSIRMQSVYVNIQSAWAGANGGTLRIYLPSDTLQFPIIGFSKSTLTEGAFANNGGKDRTAGPSSP